VLKVYGGLNTEYDASIMNAIEFDLFVRYDCWDPTVLGVYYHAANTSNAMFNVDLEYPVNKDDIVLEIEYNYWRFNENCVDSI